MSAEPETTPDPPPAANSVAGAASPDLDGEATTQAEQPTRTTAAALDMATQHDTRPRSGPRTRTGTPPALDRIEVGTTIRELASGRPTGLQKKTATPDSIDGDR
ncbi:hypothetical protein [Nocardia cyriacigeorgica]|uniref:hypothetical protein n=1 Tax=Nocardia cyriacigeorgica TaxID=135487 RepID=UPI00245386A7|nr:hypothetical protein [Nocardia cyriacigeorgica]